MKFCKFILMVAIAAYALSTKAQSVTPEVFSAGGGTIFNPTNQVRLAWTVGETAVLRWSTPSGGAVTEGFQQPILEVQKIDNSTVALVRIAPNPVQSRLLLMIDQKEEKELTAILTDVQGKVLVKLTHLSVGRTELALDQYATGVYFLSIQYRNERPIETFKVVKTQ